MELPRFELQPQQDVIIPKIFFRGYTGFPSSAHHLAGSHAEDLVEERWAGHGGDEREFIGIDGKRIYLFGGFIFSGSALFNLVWKIWKDDPN